MQLCHITVVDIARIVDGRIVEHWGVPDRFALLAQTGVLSRLTCLLCPPGVGADGHRQSCARPAGWQRLDKPIDASPAGSSWRRKASDGRRGPPHTSPNRLTVQVGEDLGSGFDPGKRLTGLCCVGCEAVTAVRLRA